MKECDKRKSHFSSNISIYLLIMVDALLLISSLPFTTLHPTPLHYTSPHSTSLHLSLKTLPLYKTPVPVQLSHRILLIGFVNFVNVPKSGCATVQAVSPRHFNPYPAVQSQASLFGILGAHSGTGTSFCPSTSVFPLLVPF